MYSRTYERYLCFSVFHSVADLDPDPQIRFANTDPDLDLGDPKKTKGRKILEIKLYFKLFCTYNGIQKDKTYFSNNFFFLNCLFKKLVLNKNVQYQHINRNYLVWY